MSSMWKLSWAGATDQGKVRAQNQDCYFGDPLGRFLVLADGMGGHSGGEVASQLTVDAVIEVMNELDWDNLPPPRELIARCVEAAINSLKNWVASHPEQSDLGTTLLLWIRNGDQVIVASLGDSRVFLFRGDGLFQLTMDQIIETELRRRGATRENASRSPGAAYLSRCIMASRNCEADVICIDGRPGDIWLLCSDGLTREVEHNELRATISRLRASSVKEIAHTLLTEAIVNGGRDNVTVTVARAE